LVGEEGGRERLLLRRDGTHTEQMVIGCGFRGLEDRWHPLGSVPYRLGPRARPVPQRDAHHGRCLAEVDGVTYTAYEERLAPLAPATLTFGTFETRLGKHFGSSQASLHLQSFTVAGAQVEAVALPFDPEHVRILARLRAEQPVAGLARQSDRFLQYVLRNLGSSMQPVLRRELAPERYYRVFANAFTGLVRGPTFDPYLDQLDRPWMQHMPDHLVGESDFYGAIAVRMLATGRTHQAERLLRAFETGWEEGVPGSRGVYLEALVRARQRLGDEAGALRALAKRLSIAPSPSLTLNFVRNDRELAPLLKRLEARRAQGGTP